MRKEKERNLRRNNLKKRNCICRFPDNHEACMVVDVWRAGGTMKRQIRDIKEKSNSEQRKRIPIMM